MVESGRVSVRIELEYSVTDVVKGEQALDVVFVTVTGGRLLQED